MVQNRAVSVVRKFIEDGASGQWAFCIRVEGASAKRGLTLRRPSIDYREVLNDADFAIFARLRSLRKELAEKDGVPPYAVFTDEQLAAIVQRRVSSKSALREIDGASKHQGKALKSTRDLSRQHNDCCAPNRKALF